jgi:hypothetical protein
MVRGNGERSRTKSRGFIRRDKRAFLGFTVFAVLKVAFLKPINYFFSAIALMAIAIENKRHKPPIRILLLFRPLSFNVFANS